MHPTRVLVVDDNRVFLDLAKAALVAADYAVDTAPSAADALVQITTFMPDLILMDVQMPVMDGIQLTQRLKADPTTQHIVIVAFTAYALRGDAANLQAAGFNGYIGKPVNVMTLPAEVRFWLEAPASARGSDFAWP